MRRLNLLILAALFIALATPLLHPARAYASLSGPCFVTASVSGSDGGTFETINPFVKTGVYTVPISGSANYDGGINVQVPEEGRAISGSVSVALPFGASVSIKSWSDDDAKATGDKGTVTWDLPDATPRGIEMTVSGRHSDIQSCSGSISVKLDGSLLDSAVGVATTAATVLAAVHLLVLGAAWPRDHRLLRGAREARLPHREREARRTSLKNRLKSIALSPLRYPPDLWSAAKLEWDARRRRARRARRARGRPVVGAISGLFFGLFLTFALLQMSLFPLNSSLVVILPIVTLILGGLNGYFTPLRFLRR